MAYAGSSFVDSRQKKYDLLTKQKAGEFIEYVAGENFEEQLEFAQKIYRNQLTVPYSTKATAEERAILGMSHNWPDLTGKQIEEMLSGEPVTAADTTNLEIQYLETAEGPQLDLVAMADDLGISSFHTQFERSQINPKLTYQMWAQLNAWEQNPKSFFDALPSVIQSHYRRSEAIEAAFMKAISSWASYLTFVLEALTNPENPPQKIPVSQNTLKDIMWHMALERAINPQTSTQEKLFPHLTKFQNEPTEIQIAAMRSILYFKDTGNLLSLTNEQLLDEKYLADINRKYWNFNNWIDTFPHPPPTTHT